MGGKPPILASLEDYMPSKWIQKAVSRMKKKGTVGTFTRWAKSKGYKGVTSAAIRAGLHSRSAITRRRANFARNVRRSH